MALSMKICVYRLIVLFIMCTICSLVYMFNMMTLQVQYVRNQTLSPCSHFNFHSPSGKISWMGKIDLTADQFTEVYRQVCEHKECKEQPNNVQVRIWNIQKPQCPCVSPHLGKEIYIL